MSILTPGRNRRLALTTVALFSAVAAAVILVSFAGGQQPPQSALRTIPRPVLERMDVKVVPAPKGLVARLTAADAEAVVREEVGLIGAAGLKEPPSLAVATVPYPYNGGAPFEGPVWAFSVASVLPDLGGGLPLPGLDRKPRVATLTSTYFLVLVDATTGEVVLAVLGDLSDDERERPSLP